MASSRLIILGSTGSIGRSALDVIRRAQGEFTVAGLGARRDVDTLRRQIQEFRPHVVAVTDTEAAQRLRAGLSTPVEILSGPEAMRELAVWGEADLVLVAVVGIAGLLPTLAALRAGRDVALANKETLVTGGALVMAEARRTGRRLLPIDSEHAAIMQCLRGEPSSGVRRVLLTGSGGPLLRRPLESLAHVRPDEALAHPTWKMGKKITVDSATLMNKGLEVLNASNEVAVEQFLAGKIRFLDIARSVRRAMDGHRPVAAPTVEDILAADGQARAQTAADLVS